MCECVVLESTVEQLGVMEGRSQQHVPQTGHSRDLQSSTQTLHQISVMVKCSFSLLNGTLQCACPVMYSEVYYRFEGGRLHVRV